MAPTLDALRDFIGRAVCGHPAVRVTGPIMSTSTSRRPFVLGAVAYDPKVVTIWEGFADWFAAHDFAFDYVLFSNYETQAEAHLDGVVDVTWDSPLAWVRTRRLAAAAGRTATRGGDARHRPGPDLGVLVRADGTVGDSPTSAGRPSRRVPPTPRNRRSCRWPTSPPPASTRPRRSTCSGST